MVTFIVVGSVGLVVLLLSIVVGDLLDVFDIGDGLVSGVAVGAALAIFGLAGVVTLQNGLPSGWTYVIAAAMALVALVVIQMLVRRVTRRETGGHWSPVGFVGTATETITPTGGEVRLDDVRELERRLAVSSDRIERGSRVRVVAEAGPRVEVVRDESESTRAS
jgi:membrane-bound ClpP family serine protease